MVSRPVSLLFQGHVIGQFADCAYETPWFHCRLRSIDPVHAARMTKIAAYEHAMAPHEDEPEDVYDQQADTVLAELGLTEDEAFMYANALSVRFDDSSLHQIGPAYLEDDMLSFRVGDAVT